jgi:hypothetical protein
MPLATMLCPACQRDIPLVQEWPQEGPYGSGSQLVMPLASGVYECPEHGYWRIFISGASEKIERRTN